MNCQTLLNPSPHHLFVYAPDVAIIITTIHVLAYLSISALIGLHAWQQFSTGDRRAAAAEAALAMLHLILALIAALAPTCG